MKAVCFKVNSWFSCVGWLPDMGEQLDVEMWSFIHLLFASLLYSPIVHEHFSPILNTIFSDLWDFRYFMFQITAANGY